MMAMAKKRQASQWPMSEKPNMRRRSTAVPYCDTRVVRVSSRNSRRRRNSFNK